MQSSGGLLIATGSLDLLWILAASGRQHSNRIPNRQLAPPTHLHSFRLRRMQRRSAQDLVLAGPTLSGYGDKRTGVFGNFLQFLFPVYKKRFFVLQQNTLFKFADENSLNVVGNAFVLDELAPEDITLGNPYNKQYEDSSFTLAVKKRGVLKKSLLMKLGSPEEREDWLSKLNDICADNAKRREVAVSAPKTEEELIREEQERRQEEFIKAQKAAAAEERRLKHEAEQAMDPEQLRRLQEQRAEQEQHDKGKTAHHSKLGGAFVKGNALAGGGRGGAGRGVRRSSTGSVTSDSPGASPEK